MAERRSVAKGVILSILTCGLYLIFWMVKVNDGVVDLNNDDGPSGFAVVILNILTCGIYGVFWAYRCGRRMTTAQEKYGMRANDNSILFTVISIFIGNFLVVAILQSDINETLDFIESEGQYTSYGNSKTKKETSDKAETVDDEDIVDEVDIAELDGQVNILDDLEEELDEESIDEIFEDAIDRKDEE